MKRSKLESGVANLLASCALAAVLIAPASAGELLVGNKSADTVWRLGLEDGRKLGEVASGEGPHEIGVSPDGRRALVTEYGRGEPGNTLTVIDLASAKAVRSLPLGRHRRPHGVRFLPDGRRAVVTTEASDSLLVVDIDEARIERAIEVGDGGGHMVALADDGSIAYVSKIAAGTVSRVDLATGTKTREAPAGKGAEGIAVAPDGAVWVTNRAEDTVTVHDPDSLEIRETLASAGFPIRVVFAPDGRHALVTNARAATLAVFDANSRERIATVALAPDDAEYQETLLGRDALPIGVIADPARPRVYVAISGADRIAVVDTRIWKVIDYWQTGREPDALGIIAMPLAAIESDAPAD
jgi:DNA-binding beta-propeller fold protein YncE